MTATKAGQDDADTRRRRLAALERMTERYARGEFDVAVAAWQRRKDAGAAGRIEIIGGCYCREGVGDQPI